MDWLLAQDENLLLAINGSHSGWADVVMTILSNKLAWIPVYVLLAYLLYRTLGKYHFLLAIAVVVPVILISDQVASGLLKNLVARPRPCHEPGLMQMLHLVGNKCGGDYGFASSHASNFFALATYLTWHFKQRLPWLPYLFFIAATLVGFSRIYLGVHYPGDVLVGAMIGIVAGLLGIFLFKFLSKRLNFPQTAHNSGR